MRELVRTNDVVLVSAISALLKSGWSPILPMKPMRVFVKVSTTVANDRAMIRPTAISTRLPRSKKFLNPDMRFLLCSEMSPLPPVGTALEPSGSATHTSRTP